MKLLRGSITKRPNATVETVRSERLKVKMADNSKVNYPDLAVISDHKILGLNVSVHDLSCLEIAASIEQSINQNDDIADVLDGQPSQFFPIGMPLDEPFKNKNLIIRDDLS